MTASLILRWALSFLRAYWLPILIAAAGSFIAYRLHHAGYLAGVAHEHKAVAKLEGQIGLDERALADYRAAITVQKSVQDAAAKRAAEALKQADGARQQAARSLADWRAKYGKLAADPRLHAQLAGPECALPDTDY